MLGGLGGHPAVMEGGNPPVMGQGHPAVPGCPETVGFCRHGVLGRLGGTLLSWGGTLLSQGDPAVMGCLGSGVILLSQGAGKARGDPPVPRCSGSAMALPSQRTVPPPHPPATPFPLTPPARDSSQHPKFASMGRPPRRAGISPEHPGET